MKFLLLPICLLFLALGCKTVTQADKSKEETTVTRVDSVFVEYYYALNDTVYINTPQIITEKPECDSLCQREVSKLLQSLSISKRQGGHSQGVYYDKYRQQLVLYQNLAEQFNTYKQKEQNAVQVKEVERIKTVRQPYVPRWVCVLAIIGAISLFIGAFRVANKLKNSL